MKRCVKARDFDKNGMDSGSKKPFSRHELERRNPAEFWERTAGWVMEMDNPLFKRFCYCIAMLSLSLTFIVPTASVVLEKSACYSLLKEKKYSYQTESVDDALSAVGVGGVE